MLGENFFQWTLNRQVICEKACVVDTVADGAAIDNNPGCTFFACLIHGKLRIYVDGLFSMINGSAVRCFGPNKVSVHQFHVTACFGKQIKKDRKKMTTLLFCSKLDLDKQSASDQRNA